MENWKKEPLVHFIFLGVVIFMVHGLINTKDASDNQIVIDDDKLAHITALWELQWKRQPTLEEMQVLVENYIRQEVQYREALRMDLDHNDEIVKRRLSQKLEFMSSDLTKLMEPATEDKLQSFFERNMEQYRVPTSYTFNQIIFNRSNHMNPEEQAERLLAKNKSGNIQNLQNYGDKTGLAKNFINASKLEIERELGSEFYSSLENLPLKEWTDPIRSGFGVHLVFINDRIPSHIPELSEIRKKVLRDYEYETEMKNKEAIYKEMKKNYKVIIETENLSKTEKDQLIASLEFVE